MEAEDPNSPKPRAILSKRALRSSFPDPAGSVNPHAPKGFRQLDVATCKGSCRSVLSRGAEVQKLSDSEVGGLQGIEIP